MELKVQLCSCLFCAVLLAAIPSSENFDIISSPTVTGIVGQDVVLPCQISTRTQPDNMEVQWKKIIQPHIEIVYEYRALTDRDVPGPKYQGRTALLKDGFTSGNVSLKLKNVGPADGGTYSCIVKSNEWSADAATELKIAAVASVAIDVVGPQDQGIKLACRSTGWFPKPELHWATKNGQDLQPVTQTEQDRELLFNVLSHVTVLGEETGEISCVIRNSLLKTEQKSVILLSGDIFPRVSPWLAAFWVLFTLNLLAIGACAVLGYKAMQKVSKKKSSEEESLFIKDTEKKALESDCKDLRERLDRATTEMDFRRVRSYMVPITLDPSYTHPELTVSADGRTVHHNPASLEPAAPSGVLIAVGREGFTMRDHDGKAGVCRWYWEVEVGDSPDWELGVLSEAVRGRVRQERLERLPEEGFWALERSQGQYHPKEANTVIQNWGVKPTVIGVYLDLGAGSLSFYSVNGLSLILEIPVEGCDGLFPFLSPGFGAGRDNGKSLSICPPSDWDFHHNSQGNSRAPAQHPASNNGEGTGNNKGPSAKGGTASATGQQQAPENQDVKGNSTKPSLKDNISKFYHDLKRGMGNKTEQEHLQAKGEKQLQTLKSESPPAKTLPAKSPPAEQRESEREKQSEHESIEISGDNALVPQISKPGNSTRESNPNTDTLERTSPQRERENGDTSDVSCPLNTKENCRD